MMPQSILPNLWDPSIPFPMRESLTQIEGLQSCDIRLQRIEEDGVDWLHGVALEFYQDCLFANWGCNRGAENTTGEFIEYAIGDIHGKEWTAPMVMASAEHGIGRSHGVLKIHQGKLWSLNACFGKGEGTHFPGLVMESFVYDAIAERWNPMGIVGREIWPLQAPLPLENGDWILAGCNQNWKPAVALSNGSDWSSWRTISLPVQAAKIACTESSLWVKGNHVTLVIRTEGDAAAPAARAKAAVATSMDYGRTWTAPVLSNLYMGNSKPFCGTLSNGQNYLIANTTANHDSLRWPLTIAVSGRSGGLLKKVWQIRGYSELPDGHPQQFSYPCAIERNGLLYVGYSASRFEGRNQNHIVLTMFPTSQLAECKCNQMSIRTPSF